MTDKAVAGTTSQIQPSATDCLRLAQDAFIWGLPLVLFSRFIDISVKAGVPFNQFFMNPNLATPDFKSPGPNIDTLYGFAWLDLSIEPQVITVSDTADRYYSIQLQDAYMNSFAFIGQRMTGTKAGAFVITPPGFAGALPAGMTEIKATTSKVFAFARTMVRDNEDLPAARAVHTSFRLGALSDFPDGLRKAMLRDEVASIFPYVDPSSAGALYFDELNRLVDVYPPLDWDAPNLARLAPLGLGRSQKTERNPAMQAELAAAAADGYAVVKRSLQLSWVNGWAKRRNVVPFIDDPVQRAANNFYALATLLSEEGVYFSTRQGGIGSWLSGANRFRLHFAAGQTPPVDAFWSLTLYDKNYSLHGNAIDRYGILDRTQGLRYNADGSLEIQIQADEPAEGISNWLPAPRGEFQLMIRAYQPRPAILEGTYNPPPLEIVGESAA